MTAFICNLYIYISLAENLGRLTRVRHSSRKSSAAMPIPIGVCSVFVCPNNGMAARVGDIYAHTDLDACNCRRGLCGHRKSLHCTEIDSGRQILCRTEDSNPRIASGFLVGHSANWTISALSAVNVSLTRQCPLHAPQPVEERGEPKRNRTEVLLFSKPAYMHAPLEFKEGD